MVSLDDARLAAAPVAASGSTATAAAFLVVAVAAPDAPLPSLEAALGAAAARLSGALGTPLGEGP